MTICIDFDGTFTRAPEMWRAFIADATARGIQVVCITRRNDTPADRLEVETGFGDALQSLYALVMCGPGSQKADAARAAGIAVDIWIDDSPEVIPAVDLRSAAMARADAALARLTATRGAAT